MASLSILPQGVKSIIMDHMMPLDLSHLSSSEIKNYGRQIAQIASTSRDFRDVCISKLQMLQSAYNNSLRVSELTKKYTAYKQYISDEDMFGNQIPPGGNPILLDALFTGCVLPHAMSTCSIYSAEIEADIRDILRLIPESLHCTLGRLRCREEVTPLAAACSNANIPLDIIELLFENGANPFEAILVDNDRVSVFKDLTVNVRTIGLDKTRKIQALFTKYRSTISLYSLALNEVRLLLARTP